MILLYHRVARTPADPQQLCVRPEHFAEQLAVLRRDYVPVPLIELVTGLMQGEVPDRAAAVTFDDGYADNLHAARPLLAEFDVPATFFVTACRDGHAAEFWWDALERIVLSTPDLPIELELHIGHARHHWRLDERDAREPADPSWTVLSDAAPTSRQSLYLSLCKRLKPMPQSLRRQTMRQLHAWSGVPEDVRSTHRLLTEVELCELAGDERVEIGGHTRTHPMLAAISPDEQTAEIEGCKDDIEAGLDREIACFAYPFGCRGDYDALAPARVRSAGFVCACANSGGPPSASALVTADSALLHLPRAIIRDWTALEFARRLASAWMPTTRPTPQAPHHAATTA